MVAPRKYSVELQQRATGMALEARRDPESARGAVRRIAEQLGVHPEALRNWVRQAEIDDGVRPGTTTDDTARINAEGYRVDPYGNLVTRKSPGNHTPIEWDW